MKNYFLTAWLLIILMCDNLAVLGCEPCPEEIDIKETYRRADLVIVGEKFSEGPSSNTQPSGPEWIEVQTSKIIKGISDSNHFKINSWDGMCGYGIVIDEKTYVIFLEKKSPHKDFTWDDYAYDAINSGCSVKTLLIENGEVNFNNEKIPLEEFIIQLQQF